ncbi:gluconolactonase [Streptomyces libani subsp. rufus]|nr:gluconolactonase [Streptomyces libani subsp. rufus]
MRTYATGLTWGEGPRRHEGALWVSDTQASRLCTDASGAWTTFPVDSPANGLWFLPDGSLTGAMTHEARVGVWKEDHFETYADLSELATGTLGDMIGDAEGNLYVDDCGAGNGQGQLLRVGADGTTGVVATGVEFPNGLALIDGGRTLVVAETTAQRLIAFDVGQDGTLSGRRPYADLAALVGPGAMPDGIWAVPDGVWVATLSARAVVKVREGRLLESISTGARCPIACCVDGRQLYVTVADTHGRELMEALSTKAVDTSVLVVDLDGPPA